MVIPLLVFVLILSPIIKYLIFVFIKNNSPNISIFFNKEDRIFTLGPIWFVLVLFLFNIFYVVFRKYFSFKLLNFTPKRWLVLPIFCLLVLITFFIRIYFPTGYWIPYITIQPAHLVQYIFCFILGIYAYQFQLFNKITYKLSVKLFTTAQLLIILILPLLYYWGRFVPIDNFKGGNTIYSLIYVIWEYSLGILLTTSILGIFRAKLNFKIKFISKLANSTFEVYIIHSLILVLFSIGLQSLALNSFIKFVLVSPFILLFCFLSVYFYKKIVNK